MKKSILAILLAIAMSISCYSQSRYQSPNAPDVEVSVISGGIMVDIDDGTSIVLYPQGFLSCYMYYAYGNVSALFTADLSSMLLYVNGQTYQYTLSSTTPTSSPGFNYPAIPTPATPPPAYYDNYRSDADRAYYRSQIKEMEYKIRDAERSLRMYERMNRKDPSISSMQLVQSQRSLIRTYYERLQWLESQVY